MKERNDAIKGQRGFRVSYIMVHQLINSTNEITMNGNMKKTTTMLILDLEKAFNLVQQDCQNYKLCKQKVPTDRQDLQTEGTR